MVLNAVEPFAYAPLLLQVNLAQGISISREQAGTSQHPCGCDLNALLSTLHPEGEEAGAQRL